MDDYERRHAPLVPAHREAIERDAAWLLANFDGPGLFEMATDLGVRMMDCGPGDAPRIARAIARRGTP